MLRRPTPRPMTARSAARCCARSCRGTKARWRPRGPFPNSRCTSRPRPEASGIAASAVVRSPASKGRCAAAATSVTPRAAGPQGRHPRDRRQPVRGRLLAAARDAGAGVAGRRPRLRA